MAQLKTMASKDPQLNFCEDMLCTGAAYRARTLCQHHPNRSNRPTRLIEKKNNKKTASGGKILSFFPHGQHGFLP